jgi:mono/diheme cytochrome c family protein
MKTLSLSVLSVLLTLFLVSFALQQNQPKPWTVPAESKNKANPLKGDKDATSEGKTLYVKHCQSCHGKTGLGDGPKAKLLDTYSGDFSASAFQSQTDGEHFYKTKEGRDDMPAYKGKLSDDEIWSVVNYMRTFKK